MHIGVRCKLNAYHRQHSVVVDIRLRTPPLLIANVVCNHLIR